MDAALLLELLEPAMLARKKINELIASWHGAALRPGLLSRVLDGATAQGITEEAVWSSARVLFLAGFSTTVGAAANAALTLLRHPDALEDLRDPSVLDTGVDELMRYDGPVQGTSRAVVSTTSIGGVTIERGQIVLTLFGAANRDPDQFASPDELILDRSPNRHLSLGRGPHSCSGAMLARMIISALVSGLSQVAGRPRLTGEPRRIPRATLRYPDTLPVSIRPR